VLADLASILLQQGQFNLSVQLFAKAARADPMNARYAYCAGVAQERTGDAAAAMKELRRSITLDPSQPEPYLALAHIYETLGQESRKLATLREYLRFMPQNLSLRSND
jgi:Flp pilus assembly protein TadD